LNNSQKKIQVIIRGVELQPFNNARGTERKIKQQHHNKNQVATQEGKPKKHLNLPPQKKT